MTRLAFGTVRGGSPYWRDAQVFLAERFERRLADAAGDHDQVVCGDWRKAVAERSPDFDFVAGAVVGQAMGHFAERQIDDIDCEWAAGRIENCVVESERAAEQRIVEPG